MEKSPICFILCLCNQLQIHERRQMKDFGSELSFRAIVLGIALAMILAAANAYLGLFAGMTVSASIPAAVVSMGIFRLLRRGTILENNIVQTAASAGESLAAGAIFTLPALLILGFWKEFDFVQVTLLCGFGGILGVLFTIPLRRSLILQQKLRFPEGIATAEVLESGRQGGKGFRYIIKAAAAGGLFKLGSTGIGLWPGSVEGAARIGKTILYGGTSLSPALISVGYIVGLNIAVLIFLGGAANWLIAIPVCAVFEQTAAGSAQEAAYELWSGKTRYIGVGAMVIGGLWTIFQMRTSLVSGIVSGLRAYRTASHNNESPPRTEKDIPMKWVLLCILFSTVPLFLLYQFYVKQVSTSLIMAICMLTTGFIFSAVAGYLAGLVGSSNSPVSGVTIATVLLSALLLVFLMGRTAENGPGAAIIIGGVVCCAAAIAADNMQDLKTGFLVGATPWRQQVMQLAGTISAAFVLGPVIKLLDKAYGFAGMPGTDENALAAPQANLMASVAKGVFEGNLPKTYIIIGFFTAVVIILIDELLRIRRSVFRMPVLAVAIGIYLPFELSVPIFIGGLIHFAARRVIRKRNAPGEPGRSGLLFASGLITGEALMGVLLAIPIAVLKPSGVHFPPWKMPYGSMAGIFLLGVIIIWLLSIAARREEET